MISNWKNSEIEYILAQIEEIRPPFVEYRFKRDDGDFSLLGSGGFANVYEADSVISKKEKYAIKVVGFGSQGINLEKFFRIADMQVRLSSKYDTMVSTLEYALIRVELSESNMVNNIERITFPENEDLNDNEIYLGFVVMEKLTPLIGRDKYGKIAINSTWLSTFNKYAILELAFDVGTTLRELHSRHILHRDVKLENIFYDEKNKKYKLGDFGMASISSDGQANSIILTRGYAAPEIVRMMEETYDATADIYSFGIVLYLLINDLKFPGSDTYKVNQYAQYREGYELLPTKQSFNDIYQIVKKMCSYEPKDRYRSMEEVLSATESIRVNEKTGLELKLRKVWGFLGIVLMACGIVLNEACKEKIWPSFDDGFIWLGVIMVVSGFLSNKRILKALNSLLQIAAFVLAIVLGVTYGFEWWKIVLLAIMVMPGGMWSLFIGGMILFSKVAGLIYVVYAFGSFIDEDTMAAAFFAVIMMAVFFTFQFWILNSTNRDDIYKFYKKNRIGTRFIFINVLICGICLMVNLTKEKRPDLIVNDSFIGFLSNIFTSEMLKGLIIGCISYFLYYLAINLTVFLREKKRYNP